MNQTKKTIWLTLNRFSLNWRYQKISFLQLCALVFFAIAPILHVSAAHADEICSRASLINPNGGEGGIGGTGISEHGGIGGTGITPEGGIGGTGISEHGGIGGTGDSVSTNTLLPDNKNGGTTIIGVVTGFASICVGDVEVHYDAQTPVFDNGQSSKLASLAVGKTVMLKADLIGGRMQARAIGLFDAVSGPIGHVDAGRQQMQVMGQSVKLNPAMARDIANAPKGANVRVSGYRVATGEVMATRVDMLGNTKAVSTMGLVTAVNPTGVSINGTRVNVSDRKLLQKMVIGSEVHVSGTWTENSIQANRVETQPIKNALSSSDAAIIEGFVSATGKNSIGVSGTQVQIKQSEPKSNENSGKVVKVEMRRDAKGDWVSDKVEERKDELFDKNTSTNSGNGRNDTKSDKDSDKDSDKETSESSSSGSSSNNTNSRRDSLTREDPQKLESVRVEKARVETLRTDRVRAESPKTDRLRTESPRIEKIKIDSNRVDSPRTSRGSHGK
jgi:hypothetical protein